MKTVFALVFGVLVSAPALALDVGDFAPCVVLEGQDSSGAATTGCIRDVEDTHHEFTLIEFFSIHCSTCQKNLPKISQLAKDIGATTTVRQISVDRRVSDVRDYLNSSPVKGLIHFAVAFDIRQMAVRAYGAFATPTLFILNGDYDIVYKHQGELQAEDLKDIRDLVL